MKPSRVTGVYNLQPYEIDYSLPPMQVWKKLPEGFPAEIIDNKLRVSPFPNTYHQKICGSLYFSLVRQIKREKLGEVWVSPLGVFLEGYGKGVVGPDIIFVSNKNKLRTERRGLFGVPDLLIEILSPGNRRYDNTTKKRLYERTGVKEYWLIDPETKEATGFLLKKGAYDAPLIMKSKIFIRILNKTLKF